MKPAATLAAPFVGPATPTGSVEEWATPAVDWEATGALAKARGLVALTKPRIVLLVLVTVAVGYVLGARSAAGGSMLGFVVALCGTGLVAGGASAWNQLLEKDRDGRMRRTARRPLPSGRVEPLEAACFGTLLTAVGLVLLVAGSTTLSAAVAALTFFLYVFVYTPLKPLTTLNTAVGAIPGALPPVIGWAAATGRLGIEPWTLFLIVFLWQFPHFLAIAWLHRQDYERGGMRMLPCVDPQGRATGRQALAYCVALVPAGLLPATVGLAGPAYFAGALGLGVFYLAYAARFRADVSDATARRLLRASFLHLPAILLLLLLDPTT